MGGDGWEPVAKAARKFFLEKTWARYRDSRRRVVNLGWAVRIRKTLQIGFFQLAGIMVALFKLTGEPKTTATTPARGHFVHAYPFETPVRA